MVSLSADSVVSAFYQVYILPIVCALESQLVYVSGEIAVVLLNCITIEGGGFIDQHRRFGTNVLSFNMYIRLEITAFY